MTSPSHSTSILSNSNIKIEKFGWLTKESAWFGAQRQRWCILTNQKLYSFHEEIRVNENETIDKQIFSEATETFIITENEIERKSNYFKLGKRTFIANSPDEANEWAEQIIKIKHKINPASPKSQLKLFNDEKKQNNSATLLPVQTTVSEENKYEMETENEKTLAAKCVELEDKNKILTNEILLLKQEKQTNDKLQQKWDKLIKNKTEKCDKLQEEISVLKQDKQKLNESNDELNEKYGKLKQENDKLKTENKMLTNNSNELAKTKLMAIKYKYMIGDNINFSNSNDSISFTWQQKQSLDCNQFLYVASLVIDKMRHDNIVLNRFAILSFLNYTKINEVDFVSIKPNIFIQNIKDVITHKTFSDVIKKKYAKLFYDEIKNFPFEHIKKQTDNNDNINISFALSADNSIRHSLTECDIFDLIYMVECVVKKKDMAKNIVPSLLNICQNELNNIIKYIQDNQINGKTFSKLYECKLEDENKMVKLCEAVEYYPMWNNNIKCLDDCNVNHIMYLVSCVINHVHFAANNDKYNGLRLNESHYEAIIKYCIENEINGSTLQNIDIKNDTLMSFFRLIQQC